MTFFNAVTVPQNFARENIIGHFGEEQLPRALAECLSAATFFRKKQAVLALLCFEVQSACGRFRHTCVCACSAAPAADCAAFRAAYRPRCHLTAAWARGARDAVMQSLLPSPRDGRRGVPRASAGALGTASGEADPLDSISLANAVFGLEARVRRIFSSSETDRSCQRACDTSEDIPSSRARIASILDGISTLLAQFNDSLSQTPGECIAAASAQTASTTT
jgi:hypothetical protein